MEIATQKICPQCCERKNVEEFYINGSGKNVGKPRSWCKQCMKDASKNYVHAYELHRPMEEARDCSNWLGIVIAEKALSNFFNNITRMPPNNKGYDFICEKGKRIDVKSTCARNVMSKNRSINYMFTIRKNKDTDQFLLLAFNNREELKPTHVWLVPGELINMHKTIGISETPKSLAKWSKYERPLDKMIGCCNEMRKETRT